MALPAGKTVGLAISPDFDAHSAWMSWYGGGKLDPVAMSRGEFAARAGTPRLLELFDNLNIKTTWGIPGHTMLTWPELTREVASNGHEICAHGVYHENLNGMHEPIERQLMTRQLEQYAEIIGGKPRGYRAPSGTMTYNTLPLIEEFGFDWVSSLKGDDLTPYKPREITRISYDQGNAFGREYPFANYPTSWFLEDWVAFEYVSGHAPGLSDTDTVLKRWKDTLDYARTRMPQAVMTIVLHPESIGRAHHMLMLESFLNYAVAQKEVWITTISDIHDAWDFEN
ncbi:xylanase deacetylase [Nesterenkonia salmonea]|uniref:Xylanase deacetylase n=1 Tax=Nesterenkonia salmonea TaxID=1804987 RepID=A0A5R9BK23_9MICC|nr:polysaccharide deacetylase family protein [Nesterenkonia salmonea]TLQ01056.1 xylanase deacetylase [Nesterenkonia salmonea]